MDRFDLNIYLIHIQGVVQSVGFRPFIKRIADDMELIGFVRNLGNLGVEVIIHDINGITEKVIDKFIMVVKENLPELASINKIEKNKFKHNSGLGNEYYEILDEFIIKSSKSHIDSKKGFSGLPPDISICDACAQDISKQSRRIQYPFTSCTDCGPRYSTITRLPYDRKNTGFDPFQLCIPCNQEYSSKSDRRFHAQTTCCNECGPKYSYYTLGENLNWTKQEFAWSFISDELYNGKIIAIMGYSGSHFVTNALNPKSTFKLRKKRRKSNDKPFAVMVRDLETAEKYCFLTKEDEKLLRSKRKPIVVVKLKSNREFQDISPHLDTLGIMLPYSSLHINLFLNARIEMLIMTSANMPRLPMPINQSELLISSKDIASSVLVHNLKINQRVDDSVIRSHGDNHLIIRRSRGYVPQPFYSEILLESPDVLALGSEENCTAAILKNGWVVPTQHIGNVNNFEVLEFLKKSIQHLLDLYSITPEVITTDLHPMQLNLNLARSFSEQFGSPIQNLQHHVAHAYSLLLDHNINPKDELQLIWTCDGYGYGNDKGAWGGELIKIDGNEGWERITSLLPVSYFGGDSNAKYPGRMLINYLKEIDVDPRPMLKDRADVLFNLGMKELDYLSSRNNMNQSVDTTSLGRMLDSISVLLGVSNIRSYRGEPAIKLEAFASEENKLSSKPLIKYINDIPYFDNLTLLRKSIEFMKDENFHDIASWVHQTTGQTMGEIASIIASDFDVSTIGFTGGVAYNYLITKSLEQNLLSNGLKLLKHKSIPPGDGGISSGQIYYTGMKIQ